MLVNTAAQSHAHIGAIRTHTCMKMYEWALVLWLFIYNVCVHFIFLFFVNSSTYNGTGNRTSHKCSHQTLRIPLTYTFSRLITHSLQNIIRRPILLKMYIFFLKQIFISNRQKIDISYTKYFFLTLTKMYDNI